MEVPISEEKLQTMTELFRAAGDPTRIKILLLTARQERCVSELADALSMTRSAVSQQLGVLRAQRLVIARRQGKMMYYKATAKAQPLLHIQEIQEQRSPANKSQ